MNTIIFISESKKQSKSLMIDCLIHEISFEFLNGKEFYFTIYDEEDFKHKNEILGNEIINKENLV